MRSDLLELAQVGGRIAREHFSHVSSRDAVAKGSRDYVSHVDRLVEDAIATRIRARYPAHAVLGEEGSHEALAQPPEGPCWIIDPIDGTANFLHGIPHFAVSICFCDRGMEPRHGIVYDPMRDEAFIGERGAGVWVNTQRAYASGCKDIARALIACALPFRVIEPLEDVTAAVVALQRRCEDLRRSGSAALDLAYVATGRLDAYWELGIYPWDTAAGELLVRCGGGVATDFRGGTGGLAGRRSIVAAASAPLHAEIMGDVAALAAWLDRAPYRRG